MARADSDEEIQLVDSSDGEIPLEDEEDEEDLTLDQSEDDGDVLLDDSEDDGQFEEYVDDEEEEEENLLEDGDMFLEDIRPEAAQLKPYEIPHHSLSPKGIISMRDAQIDLTCTVLSLPREYAFLLLLYFKWNREKLLERYMDHPEQTLTDAGIPVDFQDPSQHKIKLSDDKFVCDICCSDGPGLETFALDCGHRFCRDCYSYYLEQKILGESEAGSIQCPGLKCTLTVDPAAVKLLVNQKAWLRYNDLLNRTFVEDQKKIKWCPYPNCEYAVEMDTVIRDLKRVIPSVDCECGHRFCFECLHPDHQPCPCCLVRKWLKKCRDDSETANWLSANTKECPKCQATIEKNGGCNHMTCRKCKYEFCWVCIGDWKEHGTNWYNCSRYNEKSGIEARDAQAKSRAILDRYLHYYNRYANHQQSARLDKNLAAKTQRKMTQLQSSSNMSWIEVQYLAQASAVLQQCRQTLRWSYAFAFYLERNNATHLFEDNQQDLELACEQLSEMFEKPVSELSNLKVQVVDKTNYVANRRVILLSDAAIGHRDGRWKYQAELL